MMENKIKKRQNLKAKKAKKTEKVTYCFVDASNLFYGGVKELGWKVDYQKLFKYLKWKFKVKKVYYFAGIDAYTFNYSTYSRQDFPIDEYIKYLQVRIKKELLEVSDLETMLMYKHLQRAKFYRKLKSFGYKLKLKPVKIINQEDGTQKKKANCDVDLTFHAMLEKDKFDNFLLLSGDGDFEILLKFFKEEKKGAFVMANPKRTAHAIKVLCKTQFKNFNILRSKIEYK